MRVLPRSAIWPQLVAISLMGLGAAGCADSGRFGDLFTPTTSSVSRGDATAISAQTASANRIETGPLPHLASGEEGAAPSSASYPPPARSPSATPQMRTAAVNPTSSPPRGGLVAPSVVHVVRSGETLN